jgi:hypothetical protein
VSARHPLVKRGTAKRLGLKRGRGALGTAEREATIKALGFDPRDFAVPRNAVRASIGLRSAAEARRDVGMPPWIQGLPNCARCGCSEDDHHKLHCEGKNGDCECPGGYTPADRGTFHVKHPISTESLREGAQDVLLRAAAESSAELRAIVEMPDLQGHTTPTTDVWERRCPRCSFYEQNVYSCRFSMVNHLCSRDGETVLVTWPQT